MIYVDVGVDVFYSRVSARMSVSPQFAVRRSKIQPVLSAVAIPALNSQEMAPKLLVHDVSFKVGRDSAQAIPMIV